MQSKHIFFLLGIIIAFCFISCEKPEPVDTTGTAVDTVDVKTYPAAVEFTEYSFGVTACGWVSFEYDYSKPDNGKVLIINSNEELENYIDCTNGTYPQIDFSKQTLITAWGVANNGIHNMEKQLIQTENNKYQLNVDIKFNHSEMMTGWMIAILVEKLSDNTIIELSTEMTY